MFKSYCGTSSMTRIRIEVRKGPSTTTRLKIEVELEKGGSGEERGHQVPQSILTVRCWTHFFFHFYLDSL